jgi:hypothetical protein
VLELTNDPRGWIVEAVRRQLRLHSSLG